MDLRGFTDLGGDIGRRVNDAVNTGDFSQLNRDIRRQFERAFTGNVHDGMADVKLYREPEPQPQQGSAMRSSERVYAKPSGVPVTSRPPKKGGALAMMICGFTMTALFGLAFLFFGLLSIPAAAIDNFTLAFFASSTAVMGLFTGGSIVLGVAGTKKYSRAGRFKKYCSILAGREFCTIKELAGAVNEKEEFVVKDLDKMIKKGYFPEGHIDNHKTSFIGTETMYRQYLDAAASAEKAAAEQRAKEEAEAMGFRNMPEDLRQVIAEGEAYIKSIREANDAIPDEVISNKLYRMEDIVRKIFWYVREHPDQVGQLKRFMSYYMPTTEKLVKAYQQMDEETVTGRNMAKAKEEIAETMDTINEAYEKLYDSMYVDVAIDVSSDITVLKAMFAQEGLAKDDFKGGMKDE